MKDVLDKITNDLPYFEIVSTSQMHASLFLKENDMLGSVMVALKQNYKFRMLIDICGVDYPTNKNRFQIVYQMLNLEDNLRFTIKLETDEKTPVLSIVKIYSTAGWFEREVFDMYGVRFDGNKDLRRILTDYDFEGFPLRKDFPLTGFKEVRYDHILGKIVEVPVNLSQEYRNFDFESPWENVQYSIKK